jgi:hypothetical protein
MSLQPATSNVTLNEHRAGDAMFAVFEDFALSSEPVATACGVWSGLGLDCLVGGILRVVGGFVARRTPTTEKKEKNRERNGAMSQ